MVSFLSMTTKFGRLRPGDLEILLPLGTTWRLVTPGYGVCGVVATSDSCPMV